MTTHTTKKLLATIGIAGLALTGCSKEPGAETPPEEPEVQTPDTTPEKPDNVSQEEWDEQLEYAENNPDTTVSDPLDAMPTSYPTNEDYYFFGDDRAVGKFSIPTEPNEEISNTFNTLLPDEDATFIKVTVDNREGESQYSVDTITGYDTDGKEYEFQDFGATMSEPLWDMWENIDIWDDNAMETYEHLESIVFGMDTTVEPGAVKDVWLISQETNLPDEFEKLGINGGSSYIGGSDPLPADIAEFDLSFEAPTN